MGYLLTGSKLDDTHLNALIALQRRSFIPDAIEPLWLTPPPSWLPSPAAEQPESDETNFNPWTISPLDLTSAVPFDSLTVPVSATPTVDKGMGFWINVYSANQHFQGSIPWLFDDAFCHFTDFHVCLNVGIGYNHGSLCKRVVHTTCPDQFVSKEGEVPPGCLSVTVTAQRDSTKIKHHMIPAVHLTASPSRAKGQKCLILNTWTSHHTMVISLSHRVGMAC